MASSVSKKKSMAQQPQSTSQKLAILDAGAQYGKVIDRRVRELGVESVLLPMDTTVAELEGYRAVIISGGPESVYGADAPKYDPDLFTLQRPILGICYGLQLMQYDLGGKVEKKDKREDGPCTVSVDTSCALFSGLPEEQTVLMTHGDTVDQVADGFRVVVDSDGLIAAAEDPLRQYYGVQFHPEVDLTEYGQDVFKRFLFDIAGFDGSFTVADREQLAIDYLKEKVGDNDVVVLVSGGVDSSVTAALLAKAVDTSKIYALHVNTGFMRLDESAKVAEALKVLGLNLKVVDASQTFAEATTQVDGQETLPLNKTTNPEHKRKIIGDTYIKVTEAAVKEWQLDPEKTVLAQGSLRPDLIESASNIASSKAHVIKTHHNDTQLVRQLRDQGRVVEPLQEYHKDEVRELGTKLGLPEELVWRQPFPGPGLAIRILCADEPFVTDDFDQINTSLTKVAAGVSSAVAATLLPVRTVGVQGDGRTFSYLAGLSAGSQKDVVDSQSIDWQSMFTLAGEIPKKIHQVNRVVYVFGEAIEGSINQITPTHLTPDVIQQLQHADDIVNQILNKHKLIKRLSQVPVTSFPVDFGSQSARSIGIRTFITNDFMTGIPAQPGEQMPFAALDEMVNRILAEVEGIVRVAYDLTSKPPGTTEWE